MPQEINPFGSANAEIQRELGRGTTFGKIVQQDALSRDLARERLGESLDQRFQADVADTSKERHRLGAGLSSVIAQKFRAPSGARSARDLVNRGTSDLVRKAKARAMISRQGESQIANQQLKDRASIINRLTNRRGLAKRAAGASSRARVGLNASILAARDKVNAATAGMFGSIAGGLASGLSDRFRNPSVPEGGAGGFGAEAGTGTADFINMDTFDNLPDALPFTTDPSIINTPSVLSA